MNRTRPPHVGIDMETVALWFVVVLAVLVLYAVGRNAQGRPPMRPRRSSVGRYLVMHELWRWTRR